MVSACFRKEVWFACSKPFPSKARVLGRLGRLNLRHGEVIPMCCQEAGKWGSGEV